MLGRLLVLVLLPMLPVAAGAAPWALDPETEVTVEVPWHGSTVAVHFPSLSGRIDFDEAHPERAKAAITVAAGEAETGVAVVDQLVRSPGYLDAAAYPTISFALDRLTRTSKSTAEIDGRITLRGVTRPVAFQARVTRYGPSPEDPSRFEAGFELDGRIDRTEFGSTGGLPEVAAVLPVRIRLYMSSR
jgi:polyisoprenoid-binding protein YceI